MQVANLFKKPEESQSNISRLFEPSGMEYKPDRFKVPTAADEEQPWVSFKEWPSPLRVPQVETQTKKPEPTETKPAGTELIDVGAPPTQEPSQTMSNEELQAMMRQERPEEGLGKTLSEISEAINPGTLAWYYHHLTTPGDINAPPKELITEGRELVAEHMPGGKAAQFIVDAIKFPTIDAAAFMTNIADAVSIAAAEKDPEPLKALISGMAQDIAKTRLITETAQWRAIKEAYKRNPIIKGWFDAVEFLAEHGPFPATEKEQEEMAQERNTHLFWNAAGRGLVVAGILRGGAAYIPKIQGLFKGKEIPIAEEMPAAEKIQPKAAAKPPEAKVRPTIEESPDLQLARIKEMQHGELADEALKLLEPRLGRQQAIDRIVQMSRSQLEETVSGGRIKAEEVPSAKKIRRDQEVLPEKAPEGVAEERQNARIQDIQRDQEARREAHEPTLPRQEEIGEAQPKAFKETPEEVTPRPAREAPTERAVKAPPQAPKPAAGEARKPPVKGPAAGIWEMDISDAVIDPERFQLSRKKAFSDRTATSIAKQEETAPGSVNEPITVWKDPKDGRWYVLDGFSRTEGFRRAGRDRANYQEFKGTQEEAIDFAIQQNKRASAPGFMDDLKSYKVAQEQGWNKEKLKDTYGRDETLLSKAVHLDPNGKFVEVLADKALQSNAPHVRNFAMWIGELRKKYPDKLTNRHEKQIFEFLYMKGEEVPKGYVLKDKLMNLIESQVSRFDFKPTDPLVLKRGEMPLTGTAAQKNTGAIIARMEELRWRQRVAKTASEREALDAEISKLQEAVADIESRQGNMFAAEVRKAARKETEEVNPVEYLNSGPRLFRSLGETLAMRMPRKGRPRVLIEKEPFKPGIGKYFRTPTNYIGAVPGQIPKDITAARAIRRMTALEAEGRMEEGLGVEYLNDNVFRLIDKKDVGRGKNKWKKISDAVELTPIELEALKDIRPGTKQAVTNIKTWFETNRQILIQDMRAELSRRMSPEQVKKAVPDDWGVKEYLTHIFPGDFIVKIEGYKGKLETIGSAYTKTDALTLIAEDFHTRPGATPTDYIVSRKRVVEFDPFNMVSERKARLIDDLTKASDLTREEIIAFLEGKKYRAKTVYDPMKERKGAAGYSSDLPFILEMYNSWMARRRLGSRMRRKVSPLIDMMERTGREDLAKYIRDVGSYTMGRQHPWSRAVDNTLAKLPWVKDHVRSHLLDRWTAKVKWGQRFMLLTVSPKFHGLNRLQTFQLLWPIIDRNSKTFWRRQKGFNAAERGLLEKHNVRFITGGKLEEAGKPAVGGRLREKVVQKTAGIGSAETFNQELSWLEIYDHGRRLGLSDKKAAQYAFMRGNIYTQFAHFRSDVPLMFQNPVVTTLMPFRRFPIKTYEFLWDRIKTGDISGLTKFTVMHLAVGGVRATTGLTAKVGALAYLAANTFGMKPNQKFEPSRIEQEAYKELKDSMGETFAHAVFWGLPGLVDLDLSYSVQLIDRDYGASPAEEIVNEFTGPVVSAGIAAAKGAAARKGPVTSPWERAGRAVAHKVVGLRWILALEKIMSGDYDFKTADGKKRFKGELKDVLVEGMGGRPVKAGEMDLLIGAFADLKESFDEQADEVVSRLIARDDEGARKALDLWNQLHPDIIMTFPMLKNRLRRRIREENMYLDERFYKQLPKSLKGYFRQDVGKREGK